MASDNIEKESSPRVVGLISKHSHTLENEHPFPSNNNIHYVSRKEDGSIKEYDEDIIPGYDANLMRARASLSSVEEKRLLRRIDWHLIPLLAIIYMLKSVDFTNVCESDLIGNLLLTRLGQVSYARTMDKGTPHNILTELKMTSDQYNLVTTMYYVCDFAPIR